MKSFAHAYCRAVPMMFLVLASYLLVWQAVGVVHSASESVPDHSLFRFEHDLQEEGRNKLTDTDDDSGDYLFTSVRCTNFIRVQDEQPFNRQVNNQSCWFKNLYRKNNQWVMYFPTGTDNVTSGSFVDSGAFVSGYVPSGVTEASKYDWPMSFAYEVKSADELRAELDAAHVVSEDHLTLFLGQLFPFNPGHFLWDNLYAAYNALCEFDDLRDSKINLVFPSVHSEYFPEEPRILGLGPLPDTRPLSIIFSSTMQAAHKRLNQAMTI